MPYTALCFPIFQAVRIIISVVAAIIMAVTLTGTKPTCMPGFQLPLNFSSGKSFTYLQAGTDVYYTGVNFQQPYRSQFADENYTYLNYYINFSNTIQQAKQNIYPRLGQSIYLDYKSAVSELASQQFLANGSFYLPGLTVNQNLVFNVAHQQKNRNDVIDFSNDFPFFERLYR